MNDTLIRASGEIAEFTGISAPFMPPEKPGCRVRTATQTIEKSRAVMSTPLRPRRTTAG